MKIEPLSERTLNKTIKLVINIFNPKPLDIDNPGKWMPASLSKKKDKKLFASAGCTSVSYYVGIDEKSDDIIGVSGIYTNEDDEKDSAWLTWFCVDPKYRNQGHGSALLDFAVDSARKKGKKFLKLYTSANKGYEEAFSLYKKKGFKVIELKRQDWMKKSLSRNTIFLMKRL